MGSPGHETLVRVGDDVLETAAARPGAAEGARLDNVNRSIIPRRLRLRFQRRISCLNRG